MSAARGSNHSNKRKYSNHHSSFNNSSHKNPKRGGPGFLLSCDAGRERKCKLEGLDILHHYLKDTDSDDDTDAKPAASDEAKTSLEDEIQQLKQSERKEKHLLSSYNTGIKGIVTLICTVPEMATIAPYCRDGGGNTKDDEAPSTATTTNKKAKTDDTTTTTKYAHKKPWDPVATIRQIFKDLKSGSSEAPNSRFISRMIPLQATCFASEEEMTYTVQQLLLVHTTSSTTTTASSSDITFAIQIKRRNCGHMTRDKIIDFVAKLVPDEWKVDLSKPKYTIVIELLKTLCGISIIEAHADEDDCLLKTRFNIMEAREGFETSADDGAGGESKDEGGDSKT